MFKTNVLKQSLSLALGVVLLGSFSACSSDDKDGGEVNPPAEAKKSAFLLPVIADGTEYLIQAEDVSKGTLRVRDNFTELKQSGYTWIFDSKHKNALGFIYQQGDPGLGLGYTINSKGEFVQSGQFQVATRFTTYGFFDKYAITMVGGQTPAGAESTVTDGVTANFYDLEKGLANHSKTIRTLDIVGNGQQATFSGVVDWEDGQFLTGLVVSQPRDPNAGGGSSNGAITEPDKVWVAALDKDLNVKQIYSDDRISYSAGRYRSQYYSQISKSDNGDAYVFSGSYEATTKHPAGVLRIAKGAKEFDKNYYFNIQEKADGFKFRKVWHISGTKFLLEFYNKTTIESTLDPATQYGIVDTEAKTFAWVKGLPSKDAISNIGMPSPADGKMYFPIAETGQSPTIFIIDPATATAEKGLSILGGAENISAVGLLKVD